jgi:hypothetical protein
MMAAPEIVCVLGMHRTGTSLITALLQSLGGQIGVSQPLPSNDGLL